MWASWSQDVQVVDVVPVALRWRQVSKNDLMELIFDNHTLNHKSALSVRIASRCAWMLLRWKSAWQSYLRARSTHPVVSVCCGHMCSYVRVCVALRVCLTIKSELLISDTRTWSNRSQPLQSHRPRRMMTARADNSKTTSMNTRTRRWTVWHVKKDATHERSTTCHHSLLPSSTSQIIASTIMSSDEPRVHCFSRRLRLHFTYRGMLAKHPFVSAFSFLRLVESVHDRCTSTAKQRNRHKNQRTNCYIDNTRRTPSNKKFNQRIEKRHDNLTVLSNS